VPPRNQPQALPAGLLPRRESHAPYYGGAEPVLLAEHARTAREPAHCPRCEYWIMPGDRIARLPGGGDWCHVPCTGQHVPGQR